MKFGLIKLAESEQSFLIRSNASEQLSDIFLLWTLKEAYSKALGLGLGFDFSRLAFDFSAQTLKVDGAAPSGWEIRLFDVPLSGAMYRCCIAERKRNSDNFTLLRSPPDIRYIDIVTLISELSSK